MILLGVVGTNEIVIIVAFLFLVPTIFYWLGRRSGYRKGQNDMYRENERKKSGE